MLEKEKFSFPSGGMQLSSLPYPCITDYCSSGNFDSCYNVIVFDNHSYRHETGMF